MLSPGPKTSPLSLPASVVAAEQRTLEYLAQGQWRKARDQIKPVVKLNRVRFLPLLIEANTGLIREMVGRGRMEDAREVLSYLATIAPADHVRGLELELAGEYGVSEGNAVKLAEALCEGGLTLPEAGRVRLADQLILTFEGLPRENPAIAQLADEVDAIHGALRAVCESGGGNAAEVLRPVPRKSVFAHWAVFIKGMAAFHQGDGVRAERFFVSLPPESVPGRASRVYLLFGGRGEGRKGTDPQFGSWLEGACRLTRQAPMGRLVARADQLWKGKEWAESYRVLRDGLKQFPSLDVGWAGALSELYFNVPETLAMSERSEYLNAFDKLASRGSMKNQVEEMLMSRMFALEGCDNPSDSGLVYAWERFLELRDRIQGVNPRLSSIAYCWLGLQLAEVRALAPFSFFPEKPRMHDSEGAVSALQKSIGLDPENLAAHLRLCDLYQKLNRKSDLNRLLDDLALRFPHQKQVLVRSASGCIERKAYPKALSYLERAQELDRIDPVIPELMLVARRRLARQHFQRQQPDKGREALTATEELLNDKPLDFQRSRWTARLRHGLMEKLWGEAERAKLLLEEARASCPAEEGYLLFLHLTYRTYAGRGGSVSPFIANLREALKGTTTVEKLGMLLGIVAYWKKSPEALGMSEEEKLLAKALGAAVRQPFTREAACQVIDQVQEQPFFQAQARKLTAEMLRRDPLDPRFRLYRLLANPSWGRDAIGQRTRLKGILEEAVRRRDDWVEQKVRRMLGGTGGPRSPWPDAWEEEEEGGGVDDQGVEGFDEPIGGGKGFPPGMPAGAAEALAMILEMLSDAPESAIRNLRRFRPKDMPAEVFEMMVEAAKSGRVPSMPSMPPRRPPPVPKPPQKSTPPAPPSREGLESDQLDLF